MTHLYVVVFALGVCTLFFDVAYQSYLPSLIGRAHLVEGNSRLEASRSVAHAAGPGISGLFVQLLTAPVALVADAASFVWSAIWIAAIRRREPAPAGTGRPPALGAEIAEGVRLVLGHPVLRAFALYSASAVLFLSLARAIDVVFLVRTVGLSPAQIGVLASVGGGGAVIGALCATRISRRLGPGRTMILAAVGGNSFLSLIPLTAPGPRLVCFAVGTAVASAGIIVFNIVSVAYRQSLCADHLLGRMNATMRFLAWGTIPVGAVLGGALGTALGLRPTLWLSAIGALLSTLWLVASPLRHTGIDGHHLGWRGAHRPGSPGRAATGDRPG
jgi:predicted MFS family arabinose efflux permease